MIKLKKKSVVYVTARRQNTVPPPSPSPELGYSFARPRAGELCHPSANFQKHFDDMRLSNIVLMVLSAVTLLHYYQSGAG